jgi:hypothetical protein
MKLKSKTAAIGLVLFVAACGSAAVGVMDINSLGGQFVQAFLADVNGEPVDAQSVNIADISFTTDPFNP